MAINKKENLFLVGFLLILALFILLGLGLGTVSIGIEQIFQFLSGHADRTTYTILMNLRLPRVLGCLLAGSALAAAGYILQTVLNNPMAGSSIIGINSGAGLAICLCLAYISGNIMASQVLSIAGAVIATALILTLAWKIRASRLTLILSGLAINQIFLAGIDFLQVMDSNVLTGYASFKIGSLSKVSWINLKLPAVLILISLILVLLFNKELDLLALGDEMALSLGLSYKKWSSTFLMLAAFLAGSAVSFCGLISFVGLIVPHIVRRFIVSGSYKKILGCILCGAILVTAADLAARTLIPPYEIPVGILLSVIGGPFLIFLLVKRGRR